MGDIVITPASNDVNSTAGTLNIRTSDSYPMLLKTSNVERISITAAGLVGIGTTAPTGKLHVYSSITGDTLIRADGTNGTIFSVTDDLSNSLLSVNNSAGLPVLEVFADDSVVMGQYGSGDLVVRNNRIGIGTINPNFKLHTVGAGFIGRQNSYGSYTSSHADLIISNANSDQTSLLLFNNAGAYNSALVNYYNNILSIGLNNQNTLNSILTTTAINITSAGVGIGTIAPTGFLTIQGNSNQLRLQTANAPGSFYTYISSLYDSSHPFSISVANNNTSASEFFGVYADVGGANNRIALLNGNVGVGTTVPTGLLNVVGATTAGLLNLYATSFPGNVLRLNSNFAGGNYVDINPYISSVSNAGFEINLNGVNRLTIQSNGNVGIGNNIPTGLLNVIRNSSTAQPIAFFKELFGTPPATNILLLERGNNLTAPNQVSSNAGLRIRDHSANYSLSVEDHNSNVNFAISGAKVMINSRGTSSLLNIGGAGSIAATSGITFGEDAQANLYRIGEDSIKTDGNLYVAGDTVLQGNKYLTNFKSVFIFARGTGANNSAGRYLLMNSTLVYDNTSRGLRLTIINATNLAVVSNTDYDTYGSDAACDDLATAINGMTSQQIGILTSFDAWERGNANLRAAALNVGLTKLGTYSTGGTIRKPYAAIFNGTSDTANATTKHVIERMESSDADATRALITTYLTTDGTYASIDAALHMPNALYASDADIEYPIVAVNSVGNVGIGTTAAGTKLEVYGVLRVTESSSGGILQLSAGASNVDIASTFYGGSRRPITFTVDSERVRIDAAGRVGIGTNNPVAYLHVTGQTYLTNVVASVARNQLTINTNGANYAHFYDVGVSANNALAIGGNGAIGTVPTKAIMSWRLSTENVGIGLTNPEATSALHIKNLDAAAKVTIESADASESYINFSAQSSEYSVGFVRDGSNVNSLRFCNADSLSANEVMRLQNTNVGIGTNNPIFGLDVYKDTFRSLSRVSEKIITVSFPHNVANQKVDIIFDLTPGTNVFWGNLEVEITDGYSNQLATGKLIKVFALGLNPATGAGPYSPSLFDNTSYYTAAYGAVADNYAIDGIFFNTTTGKYYFTIIHRTSTGNVPAIKIKGFTVDVARSVNINSLTAGTVYTTNTTTYYKPVVETLQSRIGYNGNINQTADLIAQGSVGIGTTNPTQKLDIVGSYAAPDDDAGILKIRGTGVGPTQLNFGVSADGGYGWIQATDIAVTNDKNIILNPLDGNVGIGTTNPLSLLGVGAAGSTTAANGLTFGQDAQANLYRVAEDTIRTDGSFVAAGNLTVGNSITASSEYRMGLYLGYVATFPSIATAAYRWIILGPYNDTLTVAGNGLRVRGELFFSRGSNGENLRNARLKVCIGQGYNKDLLHADVLSIDSDSTTEQPILYSVYLNGFTSKYFAIDAAQLVSFSPSSLDAATVYYNGQFYDQSNDARSLTIQANTSITGAIGVVSKGGKIANALFAHTGNIGIGISVPSAKLEVNGPVFIPSTNGLYLGGTAGSFNSWQSVQYANNGYHVISSNGLVINNAGYSASPINAFTILTNTYDVGLSTNAPAERLHVYKTGLANNSTNSLLLLDGKFTVSSIDSDDVIGIAFRIENSGGGSQRTTSIASSYQAGGYNALLLQHQGGNVGIGTINPTQKLDIVGSYGAPDDNAGILKIRGAGVGPTQLNFGISADGGYGWIQATDIAVDDDRNIILGPLGGNVGIGTTNPSHKLHVYAKGNGAGILIESDPTDNANQAPALKLYPKSTNANERNWAISPFRNYPQSLSISSSDAKGGDPYSNGTTRLIIDGINGNVGIGTIAPVSLLSVQGDVEINYDSANTNYVRRTFATAHANANRGATLWFGMSDGGGMVGMQVTNTGSSLANYNSQYISFTTHEGNVSVGERMRITTVGNVGIGTPNPQSKLDVRGTLSVYQSANSDYIYFDHAGVNTWRTRVTTDNTSSYIIGTDAPGVAFANKLFTITSAGRIGIGVVSPATLLGVGGAGSATAASGITFGADSQANLYRISSSRIKTDGNFTIDGQGGGATSLTLNRSSTSSENGMSFNTAGSVDWYYYVDNATYNLQIQRNTEIDSAPRVRFNGANSDILFNLGGGNIGVGTATPTGKLHIYSTITGQTLIRADGTNGTIFSVVDDLSNSLLSVNNSAGIPVLEVFADDSVVMGQYGSGDLVVTNNKVGIGTTNPTNKLSVIGGASIGSSYNVSAPANGLIVQGTVGIGLTNPTQKLHVKSSVGQDGVMIDALQYSEVAYKINGSAIKAYAALSSIAGGYVVGSSANAFIIRNDSDIFMTADAGVTSNITIKNDGKVGIGITNPSRRLHVDGGNSTTVGIYLDATGINGTDLEQSIDAFRFQVRDSIPAIFYTNNTERMRISNDGNVGIGNVAPNGARVHVKGDGSVPVLRVETALLEAGTTTSSKTFVAWLPIMTGAAVGDKVFIPLFK